MPTYPINVVIDPAKAEAGADRIEKSVRDVGDEARKTQKVLDDVAFDKGGTASGSVARFAKASRDAGTAAKQLKVEVAETTKEANSLGSALKVAASYFGAREVLRYADSYQTLQNKLRTVTDGTDDLARTTADLRKLARATRQDFGSTVDLYSKLSRASEELGINQQELLQFTESLNQAVALSGADSAAAAGGIRQLAQAMASGTLRGDELNSIMEQLPEVARVIADGLGVTIGQLRAMGAEGKITAKDIINAFQRAEGSLNRDFGKTTATIGQGLTAIKDSLQAFIGTAGEGSGVLSGFSKVLFLVADNIKLIGNAALTVGAIIGTKYVASLVKARVASLALAAANPFGAIATGIGLALAALNEFVDVYNGIDFDKIDSFFASQFGELPDNIGDLAAHIRELEDALATSDSFFGGGSIANNAIQARLVAAQRRLDILNETSNAPRPISDQFIGGAKRFGFGLVAELERQANAEAELAKAMKGTRSASDARNDSLRETGNLVQNLIDLQKELQRVQNASGLNPLDDPGRGILGAEDLQRARDVVANANATAQPTGRSLFGIRELIDDAEQKRKADEAAQRLRFVTGLATSTIDELIASLDRFASEGGRASELIGSFLLKIAGNLTSLAIQQAAGGRPGFATGADFIVPGSTGTDTVPISFMATPGERVIVQTQAQQQQSNQRDSAPPVFNVVNQLDPSSSVIGAIESPAGTRAVANVIRLNSDLFRGLLR